MFIRILALLIALSPLFCAAQEPAENGLVQWLSFKEAQEKFKEVKKPLLVDIYTDWCGWCKHMMRTTYSNPALAGYINQHFYPVKFNAETKDTIAYNGRIYKPLGPQPRTAHELAVKFLGNNLSYPSTIFVTNNFDYNLLVPGYLDEKKIEPMLVFMVENVWQSAVFDDFNKHFTHTFYDTVYKKGSVKEYSFAEVQALMKKKPKKVLVSLSADFCNSGRVMNNTSFSDTSLAAYINKNFYLVKFNIASTDTVLFRNEKFFNTPVNNFPMHTLAFRLSNNRFSLPALCILDEELNTIDVLNYYQGPERLKPILSFIGSNAYRTKTFNDFMQEYQSAAGSQKPPGKK